MDKNKGVDAMTPVEINSFLAERVMEYIVNNRKPTALGAIWIVRGDPLAMYPPSTYDPYHSTAQAVEALLEFAKGHPEITIEWTWTGPEHHMIIRDYAYGHRFRVYAVEQCDDGKPAPIICRAIVAARMAEETKDALL